MRGSGRVYSNSRGGGSSSRGSYRNTNSYGNRGQTSQRPVGRYDDGHYSSSRYNSYGGASSSYTSRNRDKFSNNSGRTESTYKRNYRVNDTSRDRSVDRKRSRPDDYRRNASIGRGNRTPPLPVPSNVGYRGSNVNNYRGTGANNRGPRDNSTGRHRSPSITIRRPIRTGYVSRQRGNLTANNRIIRSSTRGGTRLPQRRDLNDGGIIRRRVIYTQPRDHRTRIVKMARLNNSTFRRSRIIRRSKSPRRSRTKKDDSSDEADNANKDTEYWKHEDENTKESDEDLAKMVSSKRLKSAEKDEEADAASNNDDDIEDDEDAETAADKDAAAAVVVAEADAEASADAEPDKKKTKRNEEATTNADKQNDGNDEIADKKLKIENDDAASVEAKKDGKKTKSKESADESRRSKDKDKSIKKSSSSRKDEKSSSKRKSERTDESLERRERRSHRDDFVNRNPHFIKLTCVHCQLKCVTFKEYCQHLYSRTHKIAIRQVAIRQRAHLLRLRARQRTAQRQIEEKCNEEHESKFCYLCRLHYSQPKAKHQLSEHHKAMKKFLMPYCSTCHLAFKSPMLYEIHRCSLEHIRNKARKHDSDSDQSGDDMRDLDLNKFLTVDSVGEIDDLEELAEMDVDALLAESDDDMEMDIAVGEEFVNKVEAYYCEICNTCTRALLTKDAYVKKHCTTRAHKISHRRHNEELEKEKLAFEAKTIEEAEIKSEIVELSENTAAVADAAAKTVEETEEENSVNTKSETSDAKTKSPTVADADTKPSKSEGLNTESINMWDEVDRDLGDLLATAEDEEMEEDEDESVLNIDIESEKTKKKDKENDYDKLKEKRTSIDAIDVKEVKEEIVEREFSSNMDVNGKEEAEADNKSVKNLIKPVVVAIAKTRPKRKAIKKVKSSN